MEVNLITDFNNKFLELKTSSFRILIVTDNSERSCFFFIIAEVVLLNLFIIYY